MRHSHKNHIGTESVQPVVASPCESGVSIFDPNGRKVELVFVRRPFLAAYFA